MFNRTQTPSHLVPTPPLVLTEPALRLAAPPTEAGLLEDGDALMLPALTDELAMADDEADATLCTIDEDGPATGAEGRRTGTGTQLLADAFFPPRQVDAGAAPNYKRLSLPLSLSLIPRATRSPPRSTTSSHSSRKSLSPTHAAARRNSLHGPSGSSLLAPLTGQLHALKARNAALESSLRTQAETNTADLVRATGRIRSLEGGVEEGVRALEDEVKRRTLECEGWEAEANRLAKELERVEEGRDVLKRLRSDVERVEAERDVEVAYKKRYKDQVSRMRNELNGRRLREKWELAIMDAVDRKTECHAVSLEFDVAQLTLQTALDQIRIDELEDVVEQQSTKIDNLSAARMILLDANETSTALVADLRVELAAATKDAKSLRKDLALAQAAAERVDELEAELARVRAEQGQQWTEGKELADVRKVLEKEKAARTKADAEAKDAKASLKDAQVSHRDALKDAQAALREANKALAVKTKEADAATRSAEAARATLAEAKAKARAAKAAPLPSVKVLAARKRRSLSKDGSDPVEAIEAEQLPEVEEGDEEDDAPMDEADEVEQEQEQPARESRPAPVATPTDDDEADSAPQSDGPANSDEESYRPVKSKSRGTVVAARKAQAVAVAAAADVDDEPPSPKSAKKRKADSAPPAKSGVLADKSTNKRLKKDKPVIAAAPARKKRETTAAPEDADDAPDADAEADADADADAVSGKTKKKKKMRKLFAGNARKFDWPGESGDINGLGLPMTLSPVKGGAAPRKGLGLLGGRAGSIFG